MTTLDRFSDLLATAAGQLPSISAADAARRPRSDAWSKKEELGHLIDSALHNWPRIIRVQLESSPTLPDYAADLWAERQGHQDRDWNELIALWSLMNQHMLAAARRIPAAALARTGSIAGANPITLEFLLEDYLDHMVHHLQHIGISVGQFRRAESAYV